MTPGTGEIFFLDIPFFPFNHQPNGRLIIKVWEGVSLVKKLKTENMEEKILSAASQLFSQKGYNPTSLNEIAAQVGLHKTTLFHYFKSKEELLMRVMDESLRDHIPVLKRLLDDANLTPEEKFRLALKRQILVTCKYKEHINVYLTEAKSLSQKKRERYKRQRKQYETYFEEIIRQIQREKKTHLFKGLNPKIVKLGILGMCNWLIKWYDESGGSTPQEIYETLYSLLTRNPCGNSEAKSSDLNGVEAEILHGLQNFLPTPRS